MPVSDLHRDIATIALRAAARHGFALAGGNALLAHEYVARPTEDVDLFTNVESGVAAAADAVESAAAGQVHGLAPLTGPGALPGHGRAHPGSR